MSKTHKESALVTGCLLQYRVDPAPRLRMLLECSHEGIDLLALVVILARVHRHDDLHDARQVRISPPGSLACFQGQTEDSAVHVEVNEANLIEKRDIQGLVEV